MRKTEEYAVFDTRGSFRTMSIKRPIKEPGPDSLRFARVRRRGKILGVLVFQPGNEPITASDILNAWGN